MKRLNDSNPMVSSDPNNLIVKLQRRTTKFYPMVAGGVRFGSFFLFIDQVGLRSSVPILCIGIELIIL